MATTDDLRRRIAGLARLAGLDVSAALRTVESFAEAEALLNDILPALADAYGSAAAAVAAEWYDEVREELEVSGRFRAIPAGLPDSMGTQELAGWARGRAANLATFEALVLGGLQRRIANMARETVTGSAVADPRARGWMRVARPDGCSFCYMLASRGAVFRESTVRFASHDDCNCQAAPAFAGKGDLFDVDAYKRSSRRWHGDDKSESAKADDARARKWIADHL